MTAKDQAFSLRTHLSHAQETACELLQFESLRPKSAELLHKIITITSAALCSEAVDDITASEVSLLVRRLEEVNDPLLLADLADDKFKIRSARSRL